MLLGKSFKGNLIPATFIIRSAEGKNHIGENIKTLIKVLLTLQSFVKPSNAVNNGARKDVVGSVDLYL